MSGSACFFWVNKGIKKPTPKMSPETILPIMVPLSSAMQLRPMLRVEGVKGNTHDQDVFTQSHMFEFANSIVLTGADLW